MTDLEMRAAIVNKYGSIIRGQEVSKMTEHQVYCIYQSIMNRQRKEEERKREIEANKNCCGNCGWYTGNTCSKSGLIIDPSCNPCKSYDDLRSDCHQMTLFETNIKGS